MRDLLSIGTSRGCEMIGTGIGLGLSGYRVNPPGVIPVLDLNFASLKSLVAATGPTPSFSRASTGTYFNSSGVLTSAAVNEPRFDHVLGNGVWVSKGLLIEEQRTNLCTYSEDLNSWGYKVRMTVSSDAVVSPDGTQNADLIYPSSTGSFSQVGIITIPVSSGSAYTSSIFAKTAGKTWLYIYEPNGAKSAHFNLTTGATGTVSAGSTSSIVNVGNGWYRCSITATTVNTGGLIYIGISDNDNNDDVTASGTNGIYAWGAQVEAGAFPTSYIPTVASSVVRSADVCQITGSAFTNLWNGTEGSFATEGDNSINIGVGSSREFVIVSAEKTSTSNESVTIWKRSAEGLSASITIVGGAIPVSIYGSSAWADGATGRVAFGFKLNDYASSFNGSAVSTDTSGVMPSGLEELAIGYLKNSGGSIGDFFNGHISRLRYFNTRLTNSQLQGLTL